MITGILRLCLAALAALGFSLPAMAQDSFLSQLRDPVDGKFDASSYLEKGGFIPVPIIITEPAVGGGLGFAAAFLNLPEPGSNNEVTRTFFGYLATKNKSEMAFAGRLGTALDGDLKYSGFVGTGSINLEFFPFGLGQGISFNTEATFAAAEAKYRLGQSNFFLGPTLTLIDASVGPNPDGGITLPPALATNVKMNALGLSLILEDLDNQFTPRNGISASLDVRRYDDSIGSDVNFTSSQLFGAFFYSPNDLWTYSGKILAAGTNGNTPFFMEPSINIRGVPFNRYQGDRVLSTEIEIRRQLNDRWAVVGFAGYGRATADGAANISANSSASGFGAGIRYRLARKFGLDIGLDVARGPEETVVYLQFGHAWALDLD